MGDKGKRQPSGGMNQMLQGMYEYNSTASTSNQPQQTPNVQIVSVPPKNKGPAHLINEKALQNKIAQTVAQKHGSVGKSFATSPKWSSNKGNNNTASAPSEPASKPDGDAPLTSNPMTPKRKDEEQAQPASSKKRKLDDKRKKKEEDKKARQETTKNPDEPPYPLYKDIGGIAAILNEIIEFVEFPISHPEIYKWLGVTPIRGVLFHGPPGCGKTMIANAIANELNVGFVKISAPEIVSGMSGESESKLREVFGSAVAQAPCILFIDEIDAITPKRETASREMERRIVAQMLTCMDELSPEVIGDKAVIVLGATNRPDSIDPALRRAGRFDKEITLGIPDKKARVLILQKMAEKLRLAGDFDWELIAAKTPGFVGADLASLIKEASIIAVRRIMSTLPLLPRPAEAAGVQASSSAESGVISLISPVSSPISHPEHYSTTHLLAPSMSSPALFNGSDPMSISLPGPKIEAVRTSSLPNVFATEDVINDLNKLLRGRKEELTEEELAPLCITEADFKQAINKVQPSAKREGFATSPGVSWEDVGALDKIKNELRMLILEPIRFPSRFRKLALQNATGVLLYGPPGCGKTLMARALASEAKANFISVKGPEILNKYVGEAEKAIRQIFMRGRSTHPTVIFFDEIDALCPRRSGGETTYSERIVAALLTEIDGLEDRGKVFVVGATNRPDIIDPAMLRPGRFDRQLHVPLPSPEERGKILTTIVAKKKLPLDAGFDYVSFATSKACDNFSGADLDSLVREASLACYAATWGLTSDVDNLIDRDQPDDEITPILTHDHFKTGSKKVRPSVSKADAEKYFKIDLSGESQVPATKSAFTTQ